MVRKSDLLESSGAAELCRLAIMDSKDAESPGLIPVFTDHRRRLTNDGTRLPIRPDRRQPGPQESIRSRELRALHRALQNTELMTEGQNLKLKRRSLAKEGQESRRQRQQRRPAGESKEERQPPIYQQLRGLREPQYGSVRAAVKGAPQARRVCTRAHLISNFGVCENHRWQVLIVWECDVRLADDGLVNRIKTFLEGSSVSPE